MTVAAIYERLTSVFREVLDDETIVLSPETTAEDIEGWDSVKHIRLIVTIEAEFGVKFTIEEFTETANVGEFVSLIERKT